MRNKKKFATSLLCGMSSFMLAAVPVMADAEVQKYTNTDFAMDTVVSETLYTTGEDLNTTIGDKLREIETGLLSWTDEDSQIAKLNAASGEAVEVSDELAGYLEKIFQLAQDSDGAFDPTIGKIIRLWDIAGENPHVPEQSELDELLKDVGYGKVSLDGDKVTLEKGATLDLGATGKGIGCDVVSDFLKTQTDVSGMILNLGGSSVMAYGEKSDGSDWKVALTDPRDPEGDYLGAITLNEGEFLSTSGDYEKYFIEDGKRYHHILDPKTGYPADSGLVSVSVISENGMLADALSTSLYLMGEEQAAGYWRTHADEFDMILETEDGTLYVTEGISQEIQTDNTTIVLNTEE